MERSVVISDIPGICLYATIILQTIWAFTLAIKINRLERQASKD